jgi:hypothetical protein
MLEFDADRVRRNVREATTEDLLDRLTVYREGMEPEALNLIGAELKGRGIRQEEIEAHAAERSLRTIPLPDGTVIKCSFCHRPAVEQGWGWHRLWGRVPVFPRYFFRCAEHRQERQPGSPVS